MKTINFDQGPDESSQPVALVLRVDSDEEIECSVHEGGATEKTLATADILSKAINGLTVDELTALVQPAVAQMPNDVAELREMKRQKMKRRESKF